MPPPASPPRSPRGHFNSSSTEHQVADADGHTPDRSQERGVVYGPERPEAGGHWGQGGLSSPEFSPRTTTRSYQLVMEGSLEQVAMYQYGGEDHEVLVEQVS